MSLEQEWFAEPAEGDGVSGLLIICVDRALGATGRAVCDSAAQRLLAAPVLGGYVEVRGVVLPPAEKDSLAEVGRSLAAVVNDVTPGAELYFCGFLAVTKAAGAADLVREVVDAGAASGIHARAREISLAVTADAEVDPEHAVMDAVQGLAQQLFEDGSRERDRGSTLNQLTEWSRNLRPRVLESERQTRQVPSAPRSLDQAAELGSPATLSESPTPELTEDVPVSVGVAPSEAEPEAERSRRRTRWRRPWRRKPVRITESTWSPVGDIELAYVLLLADGTTAPAAWHRCRTVARDLEKALGVEFGACTDRSLQLRVLTGGDAVVAQSTLRPAGRGEWRGLKTPPSAYIDLARVIGDVETVLCRDLETHGGIANRATPTVVVLAATSPLLDEAGLTAASRLAAGTRTCWLVLDERSESMLGELRAGGATLLRDHTEIVGELVRMIVASDLASPAVGQKRSTGEK